MNFHVVEMLNLVCEVCENNQICLLFALLLSYIIRLSQISLSSFTDLWNCFSHKVPALTWWGGKGWLQYTWLLAKRLRRTRVV